jgi:fatty-acyl-CoA synthase
VVSHGAVLAQLDVLLAGTADPENNDRALGWVPFFHDLGLFFFLLHPVINLEAGHVLPTERFARDPAEWLRLVGRVRATMIDAPQSAWASAVSAARRHTDGLDLSSLRIAWFGAERVDPAFVDRLTEVAAEWRLPVQALGGTYGLAEAVMGVAATPRGAGLRILDVDRDVLSTKRMAVPPASTVTRLVSSGRAGPGFQLRIIGPERDDLSDGHVGELLVTGPSVMTGYLDRDPTDGFVDGWVATGDHAFLHEGELYIAGRAKDMLVVYGQNYHPEDFEWAAGRVPGVRPGRCVAFTVDDGERIVLLVEPSDPDPSQSLEREVMLAVQDAIGAAPTEVVVVPAGTVEKTTSGKLRRPVVRQRYESGTLLPS